MNFERLMQEAADGSKESAAEFYKNFINTKLIVIERFQSAPLSDSPKYPDDFFNILGIQSTKRIYVPVFSDPELISTWASTSLKYREITGKELLKLLPKDWWIIFNPGQELEKEISAWEINHLRAGENSISEIITELYSDEEELEIELEPLKGSDYPKLRIDLTKEAAANNNISKVVMVKQAKANHTLLSSYNILIGIYIDKEDKNTKLNLQNIADSCQIGNDPAKIILVTPSKLKIYNFFEKFEPTYINSEISTGTIIKKFLRFFNKA